MGRVAASALDAAMNGEQPPRRSRFSGVRAVAAGAVLAAAARIAVRKAPTPRIPGLGHVPDLSELTDSVRDRLADRGWLEDEDRVDEDFDEDFDEEPEDEED